MRLCLESKLSVAQVFYRSMATANEDVLSWLQVFGEGQPAFHHVPRQWKTDSCMRPCFFLNFGFNYVRDSRKMLNTNITMMVYSREATLYQSRESVLLPTLVAEAGTGYPAPAPQYVFI